MPYLDIPPSCLVLKVEGESIYLFMKDLKTNMKDLKTNLQVLAL